MTFCFNTCVWNLTTRILIRNEYIAVEYELKIKSFNHPREKVDLNCFLIAHSFMILEGVYTDVFSVKTNQSKARSKDENLSYFNIDQKTHCEKQ